MTSHLLPQIEQALNQARNKSGELILITGGPTCEDIDPVRFITNHSSGKMGIESAIAANELQLSPILILGPTHLLPPDNIPLIRIRNAEELFYAVTALFDQCSYLIMSAAVADFTPISPSFTKLKKSDIEDTNHEFSIKLKRTKDILLELKDRPTRSAKKIAGFSLNISINTEDGLEKLKTKNLDLIVINSTAAFEKKYSTIKIITKDSKIIELTDNNKRDTAKIIIQELLRLNSL